MLIPSLVKDAIARTLRSYLAETFGTFWLTFAGCGSAVLASTLPSSGPGMLGVSLVFGLTMATMAYALGPISGCHLNPAVSIALAAAGRFRARDVAPYVGAQLAGALLAAMLLASIAPGPAPALGVTTNGFGEHSPAGYDARAAFAVEVVASALFLFVVMAATHAKAPAGFAPLAIGLALTLIHLVAIPVTNASVNPARSTGPALLVGGSALTQLWLFWVAPIAGALGGALAYRALRPE